MQHSQKARLLRSRLTSFDLERLNLTEPVTTALALLGEGGKEVGTPKLRELLFGPTAKAYGDHWGQLSEQRLKRKRARKQKNILAHLEVVSKANGDADFSDISDSDAFEEWLSGADEISDEEDPELAAFWRAALQGLKDGGPLRLSLLRVVKSIDPSDAAILASGKVINSRFYRQDQTSGFRQRMSELDVFQEVRNLNKDDIALPIFSLGLVYVLYALTDFGNFPSRLGLGFEYIETIRGISPVLFVIFGGITLIQGLFSFYKTDGLTLGRTGELLFSALDKIGAKTS